MEKSKNAIMEIITVFFCFLFALGISIATTVLAPRKGRNSVNWFFLSLFWGIIGLIVLACSKSLDKEIEESDTLAKVLWFIVLIPFVFIAIFSYNYFVHRSEPRKGYQTELVAPKIKFKSMDEYIEQKVDLNDYFNSSTGWDDGTDWNCTGFENEEDAEIFNNALKEMGIYWSDKKDCYVKKIERTKQ